MTKKLLTYILCLLMCITLIPMSKIEEVSADITPNYLTFTANSDNSTIDLLRYGDDHVANLQYRLYDASESKWIDEDTNDGWKDYAWSANLDAAYESEIGEYTAYDGINTTLNINDKIQFRGECNINCVS